jgi:hypothetical protein
VTGVVVGFFLKVLLKADRTISMYIPTLLKYV